MLRKQALVVCPSTSPTLSHHIDNTHSQPAQSLSSKSDMLSCQSLHLPPHLLQKITSSLFHAYVSRAFGTVRLSPNLPILPTSSVEAISSLWTIKEKVISLENPTHLKPLSPPCRAKEAREERISWSKGHGMRPVNSLKALAVVSMTPMSILKRQ